MGGFPIGDRMPTTLTTNIIQRNHIKEAAEINYVWGSLQEETRLGRMVGPLLEKEAEDYLGENFRTSPIGLVPKANKPGAFRVIRDLSFEGTAGWSVNGAIDEDRATEWSSFSEFAQW